MQYVDDCGNPLSPILSANDHGTGEHTIAEALVMLQKADRVVGHNILGFDVPALAKVYPGFRIKSAFDTLLLSTILYPDLKNRDFEARKKKRNEMPGQFIGRHSLEAWGWRLGLWKGDYAAEMKAKGLDPWAAWSQDMDDYCDQDVAVTTRLLQRELAQGLPMEAIELEQAVAPIITRQMRYGVLFDVEAARRLEAVLVIRRAALEDTLRALVEPWERVKRKFIPKRNDAKRGYTKGVEATIFETIVFNPASRQHIADRLSTLYGWKPQEYTEKGQVKIDEDVLTPLKYPIIPTLLEHFIVNKRLGQLSEGKQAWLGAVKKDGRIHGNVSQNGAVTGRMTHSFPNLAQVPKAHVHKTRGVLWGAEGLYGADCRALFIVPKGKTLIGIDASGIELRNLAHFMARHDFGAYAKVILEGDIHTVNMEAAGLDTRDNSKTFIYAFLYGAGDEKIGSIVGKGRKRGAELKKQFLAGLPALAALLKGVKAKAKSAGWLGALDGRRLHVRSDHAALNTLLQSAGALIMKKALVMLDNDLQAAGLVPGVNYEFVLNIHDEWQIEADTEHAEFIGEAGKAAITKAGEFFNFRCRLDGEYKVGKNWAETH